MGMRKRALCFCRMWLWIGGEEEDALISLDIGIEVEKTMLRG